MEEDVEQIVREVQAHPHSQVTISESTLLALQALLDSNDSLQVQNLSDELPSLLRPLTAAMENSDHPLLASNVYLSLLLTPNFPVLSLFTPTAFLSVLRNLRRSFKKDPPAGRKKKKGRSGVEADVRVSLSVLERLHMVLGSIHLERFPDSLKALIQTAAQIPLLALDSCGNSSNYNRLCSYCSEILSDLLLQSDHADTAAEVLRSLSSSIILLKSFGVAFVVNRMAAMAKDSNEIRKAMANLSKYLVGKAPERAEPRAMAVESILEIVKALESDDQMHFVDYVVKMSYGKPQLRLLAVDLIPNLVITLNHPFQENGGCESSWGLRLMQALLERCSDASAGTRARALTNLAQLVGFLNDENKTGLMEVLGFGKDGGINHILRKRCVDEKAAVKKAAFVLISKVIVVEGGFDDDGLLKIMGMACSDQLVSIRKAAISAISETFRKFPNDKVTKEWLDSVPPLIADNEASIQEECENLFLELVLDRISDVHDPDPDPDPDPSDHGVLGLLCNGEVVHWVEKLCANLGKKKKLKPKIAVSLQNTIKKSESLWLGDSKPIEKWIAPAGAWFLLSQISGFLPKAVDWEFLYHHWQLLDSTPLGEGEGEGEGEPDSVGRDGDRVYLLQTISNVAVELPDGPASALAHNLAKRIKGFSMHAMEVLAHLKAIRAIFKQQALTPEEADYLLIKWMSALLSEASKTLEECMAKINKDGRLTPPSDQRQRRATGLLTKAISAVDTIGSIVIVYPCADLKDIVPILDGIITSRVSEPKPRNFAPRLYLAAWYCMGRICLADEKLAKQYMPLFVLEMEKTKIAALRGNIVVMMVDLCMQYTALVDCYIPIITKYLRDPCELIRRQTFILLSKLLQLDYVKWRGVLFFRFLLSLVDESEKIRQLADFVFGNILKVKAPLLAYNSFVEAIFVLNDCNAHTGSGNSRKESRDFSIRGRDEKSRGQRMHIYVSLLKQMAPEHLLATSAKICADILASASDGILKIEDATSQSVLQDAFQILSCKEMRMPTSKGESSPEPEEVAGSAAGGGRVITQAVKKGFIQTTIPIFIELKRLLESKNSPLTGSLMECLRILLKDYKNEMDEILVADKQLQKELVYDMQKYKAKSMAEAANASATVKSVLRDVSRTPALALSAMKLPKFKSAAGNVAGQKGRSAAVLESLRRRHTFELDEES